ncbi:MAG: ThiF family adenylyltransferase [Actinomycetaceae bacterium]|nr:ThiF family adenylyltransferase [Actinomycetaceae bacterium]
MTTSVSKYARQIALPGFNETAQMALAHAHVTVVGAGGLGSPALLYLAGAGIGHLHIVDDDVVSAIDLHRQIIHAETTIGVFKAESARKRLEALNSDVTVSTTTERLTLANGVDLLAASDVVLDATDNFESRHLISRLCQQLGVPHVWGAVLGYETQVSVFDARRGPIYEDLFPAPPPPDKRETCVTAGVLGPVVGMAGAMMAVETIKLITSIGTPLIGTVAFYDFAESRWNFVPLKSRTDG